LRRRREDAELWEGLKETEKLGCGWDDDDREWPEVYCPRVAEDCSREEEYVWNYGDEREWPKDDCR
jgi:hypothetical protein